MNDNQISLGGFMKEHEKGFWTEQASSRFMEYPNDFYNAITFEMSFMHRNYYRQVYNSLDLMADLGGLFSALKLPFLVVLLALNFYNSYQFVMMDNFTHAERAPD